MQTLAGMYWPGGGAWPYPPVAHRVDVSDGDIIALHDVQPYAWQAGDPVALMLHGLAGCHQSGYMVRLAKLVASRGMRSFRMDMRGIGNAATPGASPAHAGRSDDVRAALNWITEQCPGSPVTVVGFSMGGNIALLVAAEQTAYGTLLDGVIAVSPPANLFECCQCLQIGVHKYYDRYLARRLVRIWEQNHGPIPRPLPRSIMEFDQRITAPQSGFRDVMDYYSTCSSGPRLKQIQVPTKILMAVDDPMVPYHVVADYEHSTAIELFATDSGGHLGFMGRRRQGRRWLDRCLADWLIG